MVRKSGEPPRMQPAPAVTPVYVGCRINCHHGQFSDLEWCQWSNKCPYGHVIGRRWFKKYKGVCNG